jgi:amino acid transporter
VLFSAFLTTSPIVQFIVILLVSLWWFGWSGTVFLSSTRVIFAAALDRMLPEWVSKIEPRTRTPVNALLLMVIPSVIISILYAYDIFSFQTIALDATLVIAVTFLGTTLAAIILPWKQKDVFEGSPVAKYQMPGWLSWIVTVLYAAASVYLIYRMWGVGQEVMAGFAELAVLTKLMVILIAVLSVVNAVLLLWVLYYVARKLLSGAKLPLVTLAGLIFFGFLDWLLVEWFWDPGYLYGIGWQNDISMLFMVAMYALAAVIFFGFSAYRRRQGIDIDKVYKEIPVE